MHICILADGVCCTCDDIILHLHVRMLVCKFVTMCGVVCVCVCVCMYVCVCV